MAKAKNEELDAIELPAPDKKSKVMAATAGSTAAFVFLNPLGGEIFEVGSKVAIYWKNGPKLPLKVTLSLIDIQDWKVIQRVVATLNQTTSPGLYQWTIPTTLLLNHTHTFQFYIEDIPRTTWTFGPVFKIT